MLDRWFYGTLGKLAGIAYSLGTASLIVSLLMAVTTTSGFAAPHQQAAGSVTICHATPADTAANGWISLSLSANGAVLTSQHNTQHDADIIPAFQWTDNNGTQTYPGKNLTTIWGGYTGEEILNNGCTIPTPPTNTPTSTPTSTPTNTGTDNPTDTPTSTPTETPTSTQTETSTSTQTETPTATQTPDPSVTATETNTPTNTATSTATSTPTNTPEPPNLVDPKVDSLIQDNDGNNLPSPGDVLQYVMTITNNGGSAAEDVFFNDSPDINTSLVVGSVTTTKGSVVTGNTAGDDSITVDIGTIEAGETVTITFNVTINTGISTDVSSVSNQGIITGSNIPDQPTDDPDTGDQDDPTDTFIVHPTPSPRNTPSNPGEPTSVPTITTVLIPVTGVDRSTQLVGGLNSELFLNLGLGMLGIGLVLQGLSRRQRERIATS